ncbi:MAG: tRNA pseudouridine(55) synthase TruB [Coxiellaceae bacterium]|nr:tRNA pseudouridine(55) synthase TruB [Coxiellaceae bacterium]
MSQTKQFKRKVRRINGIVLLNKPTGMSSNGALQHAKHLFHAKKAGHTGSLDPLATGMLPLCLGEATKLCQYLLEVDKTYVVTAQLGVRTTTSDSEGEVVSEREVPELSESQIETALDKFRGTIQQVPSMFSALKYQGQPLYKLARQGIEVERPSREITVYHNKLLNWQDNQLTLEISCSKGTYIRTIVDDLGELLGCGAHVIALHRSSVAGFDESQMVTMQQLNDGFDEANMACLDHYLLPMSQCLQHWATFKVNDLMLRCLRQGQAVIIPNAPSEGLMRLMDEHDQLVAIAEMQDDGKVKPKRLIV